MAFSIFTTVREAWFLVSHPALWFRTPLSRQNLNSDPFQQFSAWFNRASRCISLEFPNAFCLSTVSPAGIPEGRIVLLKGFDTTGFVFYTNTKSTKGMALASNPHAAMTFYWPPLQRQVRITGSVTMVADQEADLYFASRPRGSQISAWASSQSEAMANDDELTERIKHYSKEYSGRAVPRPPHWTGYRVIPSRFEFWELRFSRAHDRWVYQKNSEGSTWNISKLFP